MLHRSFFFGWGTDGANGRREETGDRGARKNVQEAWLYIRALEILLAGERGEKRERTGERESRWQLPITSRQGDVKGKKKRSGGVDVDGCGGVRVDGFVYE